MRFNNAGSKTGSTDSRASQRYRQPAPATDGFCPVVHTGVVEREHAELSSLAATVNEVLERVTASAERLGSLGRNSEAGDLFEVERALGQASRRLDAVVRSLQRARRTS